MASYTYDPAAGEAVETSSLNQTDNSPETISNSPEELENQRFAQMAKGFADRDRAKEYQGGISDEDYDSGNFNANQADLELQLQEVQQKQSRATNPTEKARFAAEAERIATELVTGNTAQPKIKAKAKEDKTSVKEELKNIGVDVDAALNNAAEVLSDESADEFNKLLQSDDKNEQMVAAQMLHNIRSHPEQFNTNIEDHQVLDQTLVNEIAKEFGQDVADDLHTLSVSVKQGVCSPAQALKMHSGNSKLAKAAKTLMKRGTIVLTV